MKITDKVSDARLREMFAQAESDAVHDDDASEREYRTEFASACNELLSARTALALDPSQRIADALERIADRLDMFAGDVEPIHVAIDSAPGAPR